LGRIVYNMSVSVDGRVDSPAGSLEWVRVDEGIHRLFNDEARQMSAFLLGRGMYELLQAFWPTADADPSVSEVIADFARIWREKPKYVFSRSLERVVDDPSATLIRDAGPEEIERAKREAGGDVSVGGPGLASELIRHGLVDDYVIYMNPVVLGGGRSYFPALEQPLNLRLESARTLPSGVLRLAYARR
jgi:dihydrofolate reductase